MSNKFDFNEIKKKYDKQGIKRQKQQLKAQETLMMKKETILNPIIERQLHKLEKDYITHYNNNRYFYVHNDPENIDMIGKMKNDQFSKIRKKYEITMINENKEVKEKQSDKDIQAKRYRKRVSKAESVTRFKTLSYLFRKTIKFIIKKLKNMKITVKEIFEKKLFSEEPYCFGKQIFTAVKSGDDTKVWRLFIQNKYVVFSIDSTGKTLLSWACIRGYGGIAQMLIGMGILLNKKDLHNNTSLYYSIYYKNIQCVKILLLNGANINKEELLLSQQQKKLKNIMELHFSIVNILNSMLYDKRKIIFEERLKNLS